MKLTQAEIENIVLRSKIEDLESKIKQLELNCVALEKTISGLRFEIINISAGC